MDIPARITFLWLVQNVPTITDISDYEHLVAVLIERGWGGNNFWGLLEALMPTPHMRRLALDVRFMRDFGVTRISA